MSVDATTYNYKVIRQFSIMAVIWGVVGMSLGDYIAAELIWPWLNFPEIGTMIGLPGLDGMLGFGRLRPLHTNAVIFAFGGSALFATSYYVVQRTCHARLFGGWLIPFTFWGWQLVLVAAVITLPMGWTSTKEYAELEWPIDILITFVWVAYAIVFFGTIVKRRVSHIMWQTGFMGRLLLPLRYCTLSTIWRFLSR